MAAKKETKEIPKQICVKCKKNKTLKTDYYQTQSDLYPNGTYPVCKQCILEKLPDDSDPLNKSYLNAVQNMLLELNKAFLNSLWIASIEEANRRGWSPINCYMKNLGLPQNKELTWKDSIFETDSSQKIDVVEIMPTTRNFKVTTEMITRWGGNYDPDDYLKLEDFYSKMLISNKIETPQEETYVKKLAVISLKMDKELEAGNYGQVKQLGDLFSKYMADSKFRAMDKTEADKTGGIRNFGAIFSEVEKDGHIPPWQQYRKAKGLNQDMVDKTIMYILNFTLRLNKVERMSEPPRDTPKIEDDELLERDSDFR